MCRPGQSPGRPTGGAEGSVRYTWSDPHGGRLSLRIAAEEHRSLRRSLLLAVVLLLPLAAPAQDGARAGEQATARTGRGVLSFTFENDMWAGTDRYYTSGHRIGWQSRSGAPDPLARAGGWLAPWLLPGEAPVEWGVSLAQSMYVSRHRMAHRPPRDDRPYAGHLGLAFSLHAADERRFGVAELSLGVVGPAALAEQVQDLVHDAIGVEKLGGWDLQVSNRPVAMLSLEQRVRLARRLGPLEIDAVPALGANLGNLQTSAAGALLLRIGQGLAMDFGPPRVRPALSGLGVFRPPDGLAWYAYAGVEGRAVAYDATLDGNRHDYWRVDRTPLVGELLGGAVLAWGPLRFDASLVLRSRTFDEQSAAPHAFTATTLTFAF